jgi:transposase
MGRLRAISRVLPRRREPSWKAQTLSEERTWNATQLAEALGESFGVEVTPEAIRQHLRSMGYSWKRTRYVPSKPPADPDEEREAAKELEALKKGLEKESSF